MTLKISFFELLKENLKRRLWSIAFSITAFLFMYPVAAMIMAGNALNINHMPSSAEPAVWLARQKLYLYKSFLAYSGGENAFISFMLMMIAACLAFSGFSYLHDTKKTDFYHSLPLKRAVLFNTVNVNSIAIAIVPYLVMSLTAGLIIGSYTGRSDITVSVLRGTLYHSVFFINQYLVFVLAAMLTGHFSVCILGALVFLLYGPAFLGLIYMCMASYFDTYLPDYTLMYRQLQFSSPIAMCFNVSDLGVWIRALVSAAASVILYLLIILIYRKRSSESAGKAMAFKCTESPVKILTVTPLALFGAIVMHQLMDSVAWAVFGLISTLIISGCVIEIIYCSDFKMLLNRSWQLPVLGIAAFMLFMFFKNDISGFDRYIPASNEIESAGIVCDVLDNTNDYNNDLRLEENEYGDYHIINDFKSAQDILKEMNITDTAVMSQIAEKCIEYISDNDYFDHLYEAMDGIKVDTCNVRICWKLKNGTVKYRNYYAPASLLIEEFEKVYELPAYKTSVYPVLNMDSAELSGINYQDLEGYHKMSDISDEQKTALFECYKNELEKLKASDRRREDPVCCLQFKSHAFQRDADIIRESTGYLAQFNSVGYYPVYPSFENTLSLISEYGIELNKRLNSDDIVSIEIHDIRMQAGIDYTEMAELREPPLIVMDKTDIEEVLDACALTNLNCRNTMSPKFDGFEIIVMLPYTDIDAGLSGSGYTVVDEAYGDYTRFGIVMRADSVPDFVKEYFELTEADMKSNVYGGL